MKSSLVPEESAKFGRNFNSLEIFWPMMKQENGQNSIGNTFIICMIHG
jgi:hypothetical protein